MTSNFAAWPGLLALAALSASPAQAAVTIPSIETIETRLCPVGGAGALRLGLSAPAQDPALRKAFSGTNAPIAPFGEARAIYTQWSERLSGIEFNGASPDGVDNLVFVEGMIEQAEAAGWTRMERKAPGSLMMEPEVFQKLLSTADGPRLMVLEFEASGNVALRCGDPELFKISDDEGLEQLAAGSPRPVMPDGPAHPLGSLRPEDCARPEIRDNLLKVLNDGDRPELTGAMDQANMAERFQSRLRTWLRWKMVNSGKTDDQVLWEIEEKVAPKTIDQIEMEFGDLAGSIVAIDEARKKGDAEGECRALARMVGGTARGSSAEAIRLAKVNAALEAEAKRLGITLD